MRTLRVLQKSLLSPTSAADADQSQSVAGSLHSPSTLCSVSYASGVARGQILVLGPNHQRCRVMGRRERCPSSNVGLSESSQKIFFSKKLSSKSAKFDVKINDPVSGKFKD